jgi:hypothetical protein
MMISGNSKAKANYEVLVSYGGTIGQVIEGALTSIAIGEQTIVDSSGLSVVVKREHAMLHLFREGWLQLLCTVDQTFRLAPTLGGNKPKIVVIFSLHENSMVWMHSVTFADGSAITRQGLTQPSIEKKRAR